MRFARLHCEAEQGELNWIGVESVRNLEDGGTYLIADCLTEDFLPAEPGASSPCLADTTNHEKGAGDGRTVGYRQFAPSRGMEIVLCLERLWRQPAR